MGHSLEVTCLSDRLCLFLFRTELFKSQLQKHLGIPQEASLTLFLLSPNLILSRQTLLRAAMRSQAGGGGALVLDAPSHSSLRGHDNIDSRTPFVSAWLSQCSTPDKGNTPTRIFLYVKLIVVNYQSLSDLAEVSRLIVGFSLVWIGLCGFVFSAAQKALRMPWLSHLTC